MERKINAPDKETLDEDEAARWLGITAGVFRSMVGSGIVPAGIPFGKRTIRWLWMDLVAVLHLMSRGVIKLPEKSETDEES